MEKKKQIRWKSHTLKCYEIVEIFLATHIYSEMLMLGYMHIAKQI